MQSTGNDIIALALVDKQRSNDSRFYSKILSNTEKEYYDQTAFHKMPFDLFLWLCWSIKESVYKCLKRNQPELVFSPTGIIIQQINFAADSEANSCDMVKWEGRASAESGYSGSITANDKTCYFRSKIYKELISTVVSEDETFEHTFWGFELIDDTSAEQQSIAVRAFLLQKLQTVLPGKELKIEKAAAGYPVIMEGTTLLNLPVSFAHHGKFIAYSFLLIA